MSEPTYSEIVEEMMLAVSASIEYIKKQGDSHIVVKNGRLISTQGGIFLYEFECNKLDLIDEDAHVEVRIGDSSAPGKVSAVADGSVTVEVEESLGQNIAEARLIISAYFLLEQLNEKLVSLKDKDDNHLARKLFGLTPRITASDDNYRFPAAKYELNDFQEKAVRLALGSDVTFIWGPPGTGKTFTIARLVEALLQQDLSVLLISHTNTATDGALLDVVDHLEKSLDYQEGKFLREGTIVNKTLATKLVTPERIAEHKAKPIHDEMKQLLPVMAEIAAKLAAHKEAERMSGRVRSLVAEHEQLRTYMLDLQSQGKDVLQHLKSVEAALNDVDVRIGQFTAMGSFKKLFSGTSTDKLAAEKAQYREKQAAYEGQLQAIKDDLISSKSRLESLASNLSQEKGNLKGRGYLSSDELEKLSEREKQLKAREKELRAELNAIKDNLIIEAKLIATTLTKSYQSKKVLSRSYDCVIVDEASMAPMPALFTSASLAVRKMILVGDFFQLPPIANYRPLEDDDDAAKKTIAVKRWLASDIFAQVGITATIKRGQASPAFMQQLKRQRRMHPVIANLVNKLVYARYSSQYGLISDDVTNDYGVNRLEKLPLAGSHLGIYDTSALGSVPSRTDSGSVYNVPQALLCVELAKQAVAQGYGRIGIISAYRAQVNLMKKIVDDTFSESDAKKILPDTVHKFQGGEKEVVIFDVTTPRTKTMYDDGNVDGDDEKLINVAFSRAKEKLIIVGDIKKIEKSHSESSLIKESIAYVRSHEMPIINASSLLAPLELSEKTDTVLASLKGATLEKALQSGGLLDERDFYKAFFEDIIHATQELIIISPFLSTRRFEEMEAIFSNLRLRGVNIYVITRPSEEHEGNLRAMSEVVISRMETLGIYVIPQAGFTHEKVAIVDRKVLYVGSLNILSQRESHEIMHRIDGEKGLVAKQYMQFLGIDKNLGKIGQVSLKHCEVCDAPGSWYWSTKTRFGMWTHCLTGMHSPNKPPKARKTRTDRESERTDLRGVIELDGDGVPICPTHHVRTLLKDGYWGEYYSCPKFKKECDYAINIKKVEKARASKRPPA